MRQLYQGQHIRFGCCFTGEVALKSPWLRADWREGLAMARLKFDVGIVVPLREEFRFCRRSPKIAFISNTVAYFFA